MKILSLFDWISCGYEALLEAWIPIDKYYASEIDKYAIKVATTNHPDIEEIWDVCNVKWEDYQNVDLLIGWSPCTWFSLAWKQLNFNDPQSKLFFEYLRILKEVKPKYFLLENVKMKKEYQDKITELLWWIEPILIDSALLTAQRRKRNYWVWELQEDWTYKKVDIPQPEDKGILLKDILLEYVEPKYELTDSQKKNYERDFGSKGKVLSEWIEKCPTLTASMGTWWWNIPAILEWYVLTDKQVDMIANWKWYEKPLERVKGAEDKMDTLTTHCGKMSNGVIESIEPPKIRKLHPIECERLQWLRDWYTWVEWISDSQRYKQLWNWWTVPIIAHIFKHLIKQNG